jgi:HSP20 family protein
VTEEKDKAYHRVERHCGSFQRLVRLGTDVNPESIDANFKDGVLTITAVKTEAARPKRIEIHA